MDLAFCFRLVMRICLLPPLLPVLTACAAGAYQGAFTGEEESGWTKDKMSIIVAGVSDVTPKDDFRYAFRATFVLRARLAAGFDCGLHPRLSVRFWKSATGAGSTTVTPEAGNVVMVVIRQVEDDYGVPVDTCPFMPGYEAMVKVKRLDDPKVAETLKKIQAVRLKGDPATTGPATPPATQPSK